MEEKNCKELAKTGDGCLWNLLEWCFACLFCEEKGKDHFGVLRRSHPVEDGEVRYPSGREKDVIIHMDSAPSHKAAHTVEWLENHGQKFIPEEHWPANSPDMAPLDYCANGILKGIISRRKPTTQDGMKRVIREELARFDLRIIRAALSAWQGRAETMTECQGYQAEHFRN